MGLSIYPGVEQAFLIMLMLLIPVRSIQEAEITRCLEHFLFSSSNITGVPCNGPPQSQHHHNLSDRNMQWVSILIVIKPIPHGQRSKHVSRFIWGVVFRIYTGSQANPLHRINRPYSGFYPFHQVGCSHW